MGPSEPKRRWYQLHLGTWVVVMSNSDESTNSDPSDSPQDSRVERYLREQKFEQKLYRRQANFLHTEGLICLVLVPFVFLLSWAMVGSLIGAAFMAGMFTIAGLLSILLARCS